jgi:phage tail tube protein FII
VPTELELTKAFQVSKMAIYIAGDRTQYVASVKIPRIVSPTETFNNTSTGGEVEVADSGRRMASGDGEIKFEAVEAGLYRKVFDAKQVYLMQIPMAVNSLNPQLGRMLAMPMKYTIGAQFHDVDDGEISQGVKREITAKFKMFSYKLEINLIEEINFDFVSGVFKIGGEDILGAINLLL